MSQGISPWRILRLAKPQAVRLSVGTLCLVLGSGAGLIYPQAIRIVLDEAQNNASQQLINVLALAMLAVAGLQSVAVAFRYYLFTTAGERIVATLRQTLFASLVEQEIGFFDQRKTGELLNRLSSDTTVLQNTVSVNISMGLRNVATAVGGTVFLFVTSPSLAALILLVLPPIVIGAVVYGRSLRRLARDVQDALARASALAEETLGGIRTIRVFTAEARQSRRYGEAVEHSFALARKRSLIGAAFVALVSGVGLAASVLVLWIGGSMVVERTLSVGELSAFLIYTIIVAASLGALSDLYADVMKASGAATRVFELLDRKPELVQLATPSKVAPDPFPPPEPPGAPQAPSFRIDQLSFAYPSRPDKPVLEEVSIELRPRSVTALVGPSGSGKSTVASLLCRLYDPASGTVLRNGVDIRGLEPIAYRSRIGVVSQEPILFSSSIEENLRIARPDASLEDLTAATKAAYADEFIDQFPDGLQTEVGERGIQLSGGQKQRIAIARALLRNPELLILDEATSALDSESEHLVKQALNQLMAGRTTVVIAHRLSTVRDADQVLVLEDGKIAQQGNHASLMEEPGLYRQLVQRQFIEEPFTASVDRSN